MIKPSELKIGNFILDDEGVICKVRGITEIDVRIYRGDEYDSVPRELDSFNYIPLTEEWLLKFGFKAFPDMPSWRINGVLSLKKEGSAFFIYLHGYSREIQYVHQLQNLYFSLTGEELTIKQDAEKATS